MHQRCHLYLPTGVIAIDLARQTLQLVPGTYALVVSTENITQNWYHGNQKSMLIPNCIFRMGAAAIVLSNKRTDYWWGQGVNNSCGDLVKWWGSTERAVGDPQRVYAPCANSRTMNVSTNACGSPVCKS